jgi:COMPASS component SPP1
MDRQLKIVAELAGYKNKEKLRMMVLARAEKAAAHLEVKVKDICGYDSRLAMNQLEFAQWSKTEEGKRVLSTGVLGPRTSDTKTIGARVRLPGQVAAEVSEDPELCDICLKKKCIKHRDWSATCKADSAYAYNLLVQEKKKLCEKREEIISEAETTEAMRPEYADNITIQLF